jgi:hypothetical protein
MTRGRTTWSLGDPAPPRGRRTNGEELVLDFSRILWSFHLNVNVKIP